MSVRRPAAHRVLALTLAVFPLGACTSSQPGASASLDNSAHPRGILLTVENRNTNDARLYLIRAGRRLRLGTLGSHERRTFALPSAYLGDPSGVVLESELLASRERYRTHAVVTVPGDRLEWLIGHRLSYSKVLIHR